jgi:hypothetical protein
VLRPNQLPRVGQLFAYSLTNLPTNELVGGMFGTSASAWGSFLLPASLSFAGMPDCELYASLEAALPPQNTGTTGQLLQGFLVPTDPRLVGVEFFQQVVVTDLAANPPRLFVTNAAHGIVGK